MKCASKLMLVGLPEREHFLNVRGDLVAGVSGAIQFAKVVAVLGADMLAEKVIGIKIDTHGTAQFQRTALFLGVDEQGGDARIVEHVLELRSAASNGEHERIVLKEEELCSLLRLMVRPNSTHNHVLVLFDKTSMGFGDTRHDFSLPYDPNILATSDYAMEMQ